MTKFLRSFFSLSLLISTASIIAGSSCDDCCSGSQTPPCFTDCTIPVKQCGPTGTCNECDDTTTCISCCTAPVRTVVHFRSQGANTARELVGWQWELNKPFMCENYGSFYLAYEFQHSFKPEQIANDLFGSSTLYFSGSQVANRDPRQELLADNFGLSSTFKGSVTFCPEIANHIIDFGYYLGLDCWAQGTYLRFHAPVVITEWKLRGRDCIENSGTPFPACYMGSCDTSCASACTTTEAAPTIEAALTGKYLFGDMQTPWCAGRFDYCERSKTGLADIDVIYGYNFFNTDCAHFGLFAMAVLPTGPKPNNIQVFEPVVGNRRHFELGAGISAHTVLWSCGDQNLSMFLEGNVTHMFESRQCRLFDFCGNGAYSRYMLLKEYDTCSSSSPVYNGTLISATCFATREVKVRVPVKGDAAVKLAYRWCNWGLDLGYNIYGHSQEEISLADCQDCCYNRKFAFKGCENVCAFDYQTTRNTTDNELYAVNGGVAGANDTNPGTCADYPAQGQSFRASTVIPDNQAQPGATAYECTVTPSIITDPDTCSVLATQCIATGQRQPVSALTVIENNAPVRFVSVSDLNIDSGRAVGVLTHKVFAHINYQWFDACGWNPHIGVGGEAEFNGAGLNDALCNKAGLNQWGVWVKGGISF